jgi:hypothetical protein
MIVTCSGMTSPPVAVRWIDTALEERPQPTNESRRRPEFGSVT